MRRTMRGVDRWREGRLDGGGEDDADDEVEDERDGEDGELLGWSCSCKWNSFLSPRSTTCAGED